MARIQIINRTKRTEGKITLRFRLRDGREVDLYHKSEIEADLSDMCKFETDGTPKKRANFNRDLHKRIIERIGIMQAVYDMAVKEGRLFNNDTFELEIDKNLHPEAYKEEEEEADPSARLLLKRFDKYITDGLFSDARKRAYWVTYRILERFLIISKRESITFDEVDADFIMNFREFIINEWEFAKKKKYAYLYKNVTKQNFPDAPRVQNTVATKLKHFQAFMRMLEDTDEIVKSPYRKLGRENRLAALREQYADPINLTSDEVRKIINAEVEQSLQATKDAFLLQCALGCRISDFKAMGMDNVAVSKEGIAFVHYLPQKTMNTNNKREEVKTPLLRFAFDIIQRTGFNLPILKYVSGKSGFNVKIKDLLRVCGINREVAVYNDKKRAMEYLPLHTQGCTKLCRKSFVDITTKVQINRYAAGLHKVGSDAVNHYSRLQLPDLFTLMNEAFGEKPYKVNKNLEIVEG
jgi:hypothetical protein